MSDAKDSSVAFSGLLFCPRCTILLYLRKDLEVGVFELWQTVPYFFCLLKIVTG